MNAERRRALEKELQDILEITNPLVPATLDPNSPTAMGVAEVVRRHAVRSRMREVGFETRFRNAHYYFCLKPGRQGAGVLSLSRRFPRKCIEEITPLSLKPSKMCHWTFRKSRWPRVN
jgi:hypothetical protein